jgi:hypothetical protein
LLFISLASLFIVTKAHANYPLPPRFSANAYASDYTVGNADLLIPINSNYCTHNLYLDPMAEYGTDNDGYVDLGLGYRWIQKKAAILGGYLFVGRDRVDNDTHLWVFNPGIEALGSRWDAHLNAYIVGGDRSKRINTYLGGDLGFNTVHFEGHAQFDSLFDLVQHNGPGADAQVGYQLFPHSSLKGYLGSYFFAPGHTSHIWGGEAALEYWLHQNVRVFAAYSYDNYRHSTGALGLGVEFGGARVHRSDPYLEERLTDPVKRYLAGLGHGSIAGEGRLEPSTAGMNGSAVLMLFDNVAFISPSGTGTDCTFEQPCGPTLTQSLFDRLQQELPRTRFYLPETAVGEAVYLIDDGTGTIEMGDGQSIEGRTPDYTQPAGEMPTIRIIPPIPEEAPDKQEAPQEEVIEMLPAQVPEVEGRIVTSGDNSVTDVKLMPQDQTDQPVIELAGNNNTIERVQTCSPTARCPIGFTVPMGFGNKLINTDLYASQIGVETIAAPGYNSVTISNSLLDVLGPSAIGLHITTTNVSAYVNNSTIRVQRLGDSVTKTIAGILSETTAGPANNFYLDKVVIEVTGPVAVGILAVNNSYINGNDVRITLADINFSPGSVAITTKNSSVVGLDGFEVYLLDGRINSEAFLTYDSSKIYMDNGKVILQGGDVGAGSSPTLGSRNGSSKLVLTNVNCIVNGAACPAYFFNF